MTDALRPAVAERFVAVNGAHPMTSDDDAYVDKYFVALAVLCAHRGVDPDTVRSDMLAGRLPLPSYLRSDGTEMVPSDLFALADAAGGLDALPDWFRAQWGDDDQERARTEWTDYLSGQYVCLRAVSPTTIRRKDDITARLDERLADARPDDTDWRTSVQGLVTELDEVELPFTAYDRHRFGGGPLSRDVYIDRVRETYGMR